MRIKNETDVPYILLAITEKETAYIDRKNAPCQTYNNEDYLECFLDKINNLFQTRLNCTTHGIFSLTRKTNLKNCSSEYDIKTTFGFYNEIFDRTSKYLSEQGCKFPCIQTTYKSSMISYHKYKWIDPNKIYPRSDDAVRLEVFYETLLTEDGVEAYVYDLGSFLAQAGGNLGLCLGFSCLSVLLDVLKFIKQKYFK